MRQGIYAYTKSSPKEYENHPTKDRIQTSTVNMNFGTGVPKNAISL